MIKKFTTILLFFIFSELAFAKNSDLKLSSLFKNNMVIQRETDAAIWGKATAGASVTIKPSWESGSYETKADEAGKWKTSIKTPKAGGPFTIDITSDNDKVMLKNVMSGEVWICSGQSNMQWTMVASGKNRYSKEMKAADYPNIRYCAVSRTIALEEQDEVPASWIVCDPQTVKQFSSVAFFFGEKLHNETNIPIGLISTNWGGSSAQTWVSKDTLQKGYPEFNRYLDEYLPVIEKHGANITKLIKNKKHTKLKRFNHRSPSILYNGMIKPLIPFSFRGVIWYQGESNIAEPEQYTRLFPSLIENWRSEWGLGDFPFYYVQIAPFSYKSKPNTTAALLREAQLKTLSVPNTGMAVTMDIGNATNIHPVQKKPVGHRLARIALARDYGQTSLVDSGPIYTTHSIENGNITLSFDLDGSSLAVPESGELTHFTIAGEDKNFTAATATIQGNHIIVSSSEVSQPIAVRFAWGNADAPNLKNTEGLPASSFRTDNWEIK